MYNPESVQENETHKVLRDFEIETNPLIRPDSQTPSYSQQKDENLTKSELCRSGESQS